MNFELTEEQQAFLDSTRRFIESSVPVAAVRAFEESSDAFDPLWWKRAAELGWTSLLVSEEAGGGCLSGRPVGDAAIVAEEIGRQVAPGPFIPVAVVSAGLSSRIGHHGQLLASVLEGSTVVTWALAESDCGWDMDRTTTTATPSPDGIVIDGRKSFVEAAAVAGHFLVTARSPQGLTQILVPAAAPGVSVKRSRSLDLARRFGEVIFDSVELPVDAVVGDIGEARADVERQLQIAIALQCAETVGILDRVFQFTREYMDDRHAFGRPISSYQALKHRMADLLLWTESAKAATDGLVSAIDDGSPDAAVLASVAKVYVGDRSMTILQECIQMHGGIGVTWEHDLHLYLRRASVNRALYGSPEQHRERLYRLLEGSSAATAMDGAR